MEYSDGVSLGLVMVLHRWGFGFRVRVIVYDSKAETPESLLQWSL